MSRRLVLIDSSTWISHFSQTPTRASHAIDNLLRRHLAAVNPVIRLELLTGAVHEAQYAELEEALQGLHVLPISDAVWRRAERLRFQLRQTGHLIPVPDMLIACCAMVFDCELLHADRHFTLMARAAPLRVYAGD